MDYLQDINKNDLHEFASKMCKETTEELAWWDMDEDTEESITEDIYSSLVELQNIVAIDNHSKLASLYYYIVQRYLE